MGNVPSSRTFEWAGGEYTGATAEGFNVPHGLGVLKFPAESSSCGPHHNIRCTCPPQRIPRYHPTGSSKSNSIEEYEGEFKNGARDGDGTAKFKHESDSQHFLSYTSSWKRDLMEGHGVAVFADGNCYEGGWKSDMRAGCGSYRSVNTSYSGGWLNDKKDGHGAMNHPDGRIYVGGWKDDKRDGQGVMNYADGSVYTGGWKNDKRNGYGDMTYSDGRVARGGWKDDERDGHGVMEWPDGKRYEGGWKEGNRHGNGKCSESNGDTWYDGGYKNDEPHGYGTQKFETGVCYKGGWEVGLREGQGAQTWPQGGRYEGGFQNEFFDFLVFGLIFGFLFECELVLVEHYLTVG